MTTRPLQALSILLAIVALAGCDPNRSRRMGTEDRQDEMDRDDTGDLGPGHPDPDREQGDVIDGRLKRNTDTDRY